MGQSLANVLIHLVFSTKNREPFITETIEPELYRYMAEIFKQLNSPALIIGGTADHTHSLFTLSRTQTLADVVEEVKKSSSKWIKTKGREFQTFQWQTGYGVFSIGQSNVAALRSYIQKQKEHHRKVSFQDEYRLFLKKYGIVYDERYVWD
ncbi:MAG TPA: IS200/IS605 family transposase [Planctomycetota bacterium]|nr:IS200/IS605 family transposase [Planctomycetota bacterium]